MNEEMHAVFFGSVQGVFFRATAREIAKSLGLVGTVRNMPDGSVELFAQGEREILETLLKELEGQFNLDSECSMTIDFHPPVNTFEEFRIVYYE